MCNLIQIYAKDENNVIGLKDTNDLPWHCSSDLKQFSKLTKGHVVIMGRKTMESLKTPLKHRVNIVITSNHDVPKGFTPFSNIEEAIEYATNFDTSDLEKYRHIKEPVVYIIGGAKLLEATKDIVDGVIVTTIKYDEPVEHNKDNTIVYDNDLATKSITKIRYQNKRTEKDNASISCVEYKVLNDKPVIGQLRYNYEFVNVTHDYHQLLKQFEELIKEESIVEDRTGAGTYSLFGKHLTFNVKEYAPFITKRQIPLLSTLGELLWFINGNTNANVLKEKFKCSFWDEWANESGDIGPMYGYQWRFSGTEYDQLAMVIHEMKNNPSSRRMVVDAWNVDTLPLHGVSPSENPNFGHMALAPCHFAFQLYCKPNKKGYDVSLQWYQRSADVLMGLPINIASYYFLLCFLCKYVSNSTGINYTPDKLHVSLGDVHLYSNHVDAFKEIINRPLYRSPTFNVPDGIEKIIDRTATIEEQVEYQRKCFKYVSDYVAHPNVKLTRNV